MQQLYVPTLTRVNKILLITVGVIFLLGSILSQSGVPLVPWLGLSAEGILSGLVYQIVTYPLIAVGLSEVLFSGLILWFIGSELESLWGERRYIGFLLATTIGAGFIYLIVGLILKGGLVYRFPLHGLAGIASALCLGYAILFPNRIFNFMLIFPMKAKYFCALLIGIELYMGFFSARAVQAWSQLGAMASGFAFMWLISNTGFKNFFRGGGGGRKKKRKKSHLKLMK